MCSDRNGEPDAGAEGETAEHGEPDGSEQRAGDIGVKMLGEAPGEGRTHHVDERTDRSAQWPEHDEAIYRVFEHLVKYVSGRGPGRVSHLSQCTDPEKIW